MQHSPSANVMLAYNLGAEDGESAEPVFIYTSTSGMSVTENSGAYIELYQYVFRTSADHRCSAGVSYLLSQMLCSMVGSADMPSSEKAPDYYMGLDFFFQAERLRQYSSHQC
ncbi:MAG: hypothetical protein IPP51_18035 [Bacteroidetes bacterium]|nr:hypothetical protein [Bacteroidota bacterium]